MPKHQISLHTYIAEALLRLLLRLPLLLLLYHMPCMPTITTTACLRLDAYIRLYHDMPCMPTITTTTTTTTTTTNIRPLLRLLLLQVQLHTSLMRRKQNTHMYSDAWYPHGLLQQARSTLDTSRVALRVCACLSVWTSECIIHSCEMHVC